MTLLFGALVAVSACEPPAAELQFDRRVPEATTPTTHDESRLVVGVGAMLGPIETYESHTGLLEYLARAVGRRPQLVQRRTYEEMNRLLVTGDVDVAFICDGAYVPIRDRVRLLAVPVFRGSPTYHSVVLSLDRSADGLGSLRGRSFAFTDPLSQTGRLFVVYQLRHQFDSTPRDFFSSTLYSGGHDESVRLVLGGQVFAASVDEMVYAQFRPELRDRLHVVEMSPAFGAPPIVARLGLPGEVVSRLRAALVAAADAPEVHEYLRDMGIDGFVASTDYSYAIEVAEDALAVRASRSAAAPP